MTAILKHLQRPGATQTYCKMDLLALPKGQDVQQHFGSANCPDCLRRFAGELVNFGC